MIIELLTNYLPAEAIAGFRFIIVTIIFLIILLPRGIEINKNALKWMGLAGSSLLIAGNYAFVEGIKLATATKVSTISSIYPIIAQFFAVLVKERLTPQILIGTALATIGVIIVIID